jgi:hypothetical protein
MQKQLEHQAGNAKSGMHAFRIPRAVRADMCASFGRHTQGSEFSESSVSRVLPAVVVAVAMLRAAMLVLVAVLMVIATLHLQDAEAANSDERGKRNRERKEAAEERDGVCMCFIIPQRDLLTGINAKDKY